MPRRRTLLVSILGLALPVSPSGCSDSTEASPEEGTSSEGTPTGDSGSTPTPDSTTGNAATSSPDSDNPVETTSIETSGTSENDDPSCDNGFQDGTESDVDCGGACQATCDDGSSCQEPADCASGVCGQDSTCAPAACDDRTRNGDETDVDCGGTCLPCGTGSSCEQPGDCDQGVCTNRGSCAPASCDDGVANGDETDIDCGGASCSTCETGAACSLGGDCVSQVCEASACVAAQCGDGIVQGDNAETCDDAGESAACNSDCTVSSCGDGKLNITAGEACDGHSICTDECTWDSEADSVMFDPGHGWVPSGFAWDGDNYWRVSRGDELGERLARFNTDGSQTGFAPGINFRSIFTKGDGTGPLYILPIGDPIVYTQTSPGVFAVEATLEPSSPALSPSMPVAWNANTSQYVAHTNGTIIRWDEDGTFVGTTELLGWSIGEHSGEGFDVSRYYVTWGGGYLITCGWSSFSLWDEQGNRVASDSLTSHPSSPIAYANGMVWKSNFDGDIWEGQVVDFP